MYRPLSGWKTMVVAVNSQSAQTTRRTTMATALGSFRSD